MPPINYTQVFKEAAASNPDDVVRTDTITIDHSTFAQPFRVALSDKDITLDGDLYFGAQFTTTLPTMEAKISSGIQVDIRDINFDISSLIEDVLKTSEPMTLIWKSFLSTQVAMQAFFSKTLDVNSISLRGRTLSLKAAYPNISNKNVPSEKYTLNDFPGLR